MCQPKPNLCCIAWSRQRVALVFMSMQTKRSTCFNQKGDISTLNGGSLKLVEKFTYFGSNVSSTENDINMQQAKAWTAINRLSIIWKSGLSDKIKRNFFQAAVASILLYRFTTWTLTKHIEKRLDGNCTRVLWTIWNKSWKQHPTKLQLYGHLPPISRAIQIRRTRYAGHCWRYKDELIRTSSHRHASAGQPTRIYRQHLCTDKEDLLETMEDRDEWRERLRELRASSTSWG